MSLIGILSAVTAAAVTTTEFVGTSGDGQWGTAANWSLGSTPGASDNAVINSGRSASIVADSPAVDWVTVGNNAFADTALRIGADLAANLFRVAYASDSIGHVKQTGGTVTVHNTFTIASNSSGAGGGSYTIQGGSLDFAGVSLSVGRKEGVKR